MRAGLATGSFLLALALVVSPAFARDTFGRYANSPLKSWFDRLASGKGLCCSFADGVSIQDVDWDVQCERVGGRREQPESCRYRVRLDGRWIDVPEDAVVTAANRFGAAVVWPYVDAEGATQIRCFMPGAGT